MTSALDLQESERFHQENQKQRELDAEALATNNDVVIAARLKAAWDWIQTSPYSPKNFGLLEKADKLATELYGKPFSEMAPDEFDEPE
jgi:hypothetical protein